MTLIKIFVQASDKREDKICRCEHIIMCDLYDKCMKEIKNERTETTLPIDRRS